MSKASKRAKMLCKAATEGPWDFNSEHCVIYARGWIWITQLFSKNYEEVFSNHRANAALIAESRSLLSELAEQVEKLEENLSLLILLKDHKDKNGKSVWYLQEQPKAWDKACQTLKDIES